MPELSITRLENRVSVVGPVITAGDRHQVAEAILAALTAKPREVILDVTRAGYIDSRALMTLVTAARRCREAGALLALEGPNEEFVGTLVLTGIDKVLSTHGARVQPPDNTDGTGAAA